MDESFEGLMANPIKDVVTVFKMQLKIPNYCIVKNVLAPLVIS